MQWYYVDNGQQAGPVEETEFPNLIQQGRLRADTLIWRDGMANWEPFNAAAPPEYRLAAAPLPPGSPAPGTEAVCAECNGIFNKDDMIAHGNIHICANCKPVFMQKLAEGAKLNLGTLDFASVGTRFGALVLDGILLWIVSFVTQMAAVFFAASAMQSSPQVALTVQFALMFLQLGIGVLYETIMIGKYGATLGKMACKIKVVTATGERVTYARALGRYFAKFLSGLLCAVGYFMALFDKEEKRTLHDRICDTRVVVK